MDFVVLCDDSLPFYNFPFLVFIQTKMGASYALFVEFSSRRDAVFNGRKYLLHIDIFDVIQYFCQNCKFSTKNGRYKPYIVNADAKKYPYLSINKGLMIWDDYFTVILLLFHNGNRSLHALNLVT